MTDINDTKLEMMMSKMVLRAEFLQSHIKSNMLQILRNEMQDKYYDIVSSTIIDNKKCAKVNLNAIVELNPKLIEILFNMYLYNEAELNTPKV